MEISYLIYLRTNFQKYRDYIEIKAVLSVKIKVVEQSGAAIKSVLQRSDPFREKTYSKVDHLVCRNNGKVSCAVLEGVYELVCQDFETPMMCGRVFE